MEVYLSSQEIQEAIKLLGKLNGMRYDPNNEDTIKLKSIRDKLRNVIKSFGEEFIEKEQGLNHGRGNNQTYEFYIGSKFIPKKYYEVLGFNWFYFAFDITNEIFYIHISYNFNKIEESWNIIVSNKRELILEIKDYTLEELKQIVENFVCKFKDDIILLTCKYGDENIIKDLKNLVY